MSLHNDLEPKAHAKAAQVAKDDTDKLALPTTLAGLATLAAEQIAERQQGTQRPT